MTREEVIKGLETCEMSGTREDCEGYGCPYFIYNDEVSDDCQMQLFGDGLALLKAQEPRVLTLAELEHAEVAYAEDIDKDEIIPILVNGRQHDRFNMVRARLGNNPSRVFYPSIFDYNKRWRCWTSRPDKATREATPWE